MRCVTIEFGQATQDWTPPQAISPIDEQERARREELRALDEHLLKVATSRWESELNGSF